MARKRPATFGLLVTLAAAGCAAIPSSPPSLPARPLRAATLDEVLAAYDAYCNKIETVSASGDLEMRDFRTGRAQRLGVRLIAARGGRIYLKASVAVVTALEVVSNGDRFWFQVPSKKTVWTGDARQAPESERDEAPYYSLRPRDVTTAFLPEPLALGAGDSLLMEADPRVFSLTLGRIAPTGKGQVRRRVWLYRETLQPIQLRTYDDHGELESDLHLSSWREGSPRDVSISRPTVGYEARFALSKVETNVQVPDRAFVPRTPEGYKLVEVH